MDYYGNNDYRDYIAHHGRLGQKWGQRNGPPYPLDRTQFSGLEKKLDAEYSGHSISKAKITFKKQDNSGVTIKKKTREMSPEEDCKVVNPKKHTQNCMYCTTAYELRRRGYDVEAGYIDHGLGSNFNKKVFNNAKVVQHRPGTRQEIIAMLKRCATQKGNVAFEQNIARELKSQGVGARGNLMLTFSDFGGHSVAYEVTKKGYRIHDAQVGRSYSEEDSRNAVRHVMGVEYCRFDNLDLKEKEIKKVIQNKI